MRVVSGLKMKEGGNSLFWGEGEGAELGNVWALWKFSVFVEEGVTCRS